MKSKSSRERPKRDKPQRRFRFPGSGYTAVSAYDIDRLSELSFPLVIYDLDSAFLASEWKLKLSKFYGEEKKVGIYVDNRKFFMPVYELDRDETLFNYSTVLVAFSAEIICKERFSFEDLLKIVKVLRCENGLPVGQSTEHGKRAVKT